MYLSLKSELALGRKSDHQHQLMHFAKVGRRNCHCLSQQFDSYFLHHHQHPHSSRHRRQETPSKTCSSKIPYFHKARPRHRARSRRRRCLKGCACGRAVAVCLCHYRCFLHPSSSQKRTRRRHRKLLSPIRKRAASARPRRARRSAPPPLAEACLLSCWTWRCSS